MNFDEDFIASQKESGQTTVKGTLYARGQIRWQELNGSTGLLVLPTATKEFTFESDLPQKYGSVSIQKSEPVLIDEKYLKYTVTVNNNDSVDVPGVRVEDTFTVNPQFVDSYVGVGATATPLAQAENGVNPYETTTKLGVPVGTIKQNGTSGMMWSIGNLKAGETRTLTYYAEVNEYYVGSYTRGSITNEAELFCGDYPRGSSEQTYTPKTKMDMSKETVSMELDKTGTGTITYRLKITADANNSYAMVNLKVKDFFASKYSDYLTFESATITINGNEVGSYTGGKTLECVIPKMNPGETAYITYTVKAENVLLAEREGFNLRNTAKLLADDDANRGDVAGLCLATRFNDNYLEQHEWTRKLDIGVVNSDKTITMDNGTSFTVPKGSEKYQVVLNEDGQWNLTSTTMEDKFSGNNMQYVGYVQVDRYEYNPTISTGTNLENLNGLTKLDTAWYNIDGETSFKFEPKTIGLADKGNCIYVLTYYAQPVNMEGIGALAVTNSFTVYGSIGVGNGAIYTIPPVLISVQSTVQGSVSYNTVKKAWYYEDGKVYWVVKLDGDIKKGLALLDEQTERNANDNNFSSATKMNEELILDVFKASDTLDPTTFSSYAALTQYRVENNIKLLSDTGTTESYTLTSITDTGSLDGRSFVIANVNMSASKYYYLPTDYRPGKKAMNAQDFPTTAVVGNTLNLTNPVVWTFHKGTGDYSDKYYLTTISDGTLYYLPSSTNQTGNISTNLTENCYFTVEASSKSGQILLKNIGGNYITLVVDLYPRFSADNTSVDTDYKVNQSSLSLFEFTSNRDYTVAAGTSSVQIEFAHDIDLDDNEAVYAVFGVTVNSPLKDDTDDNKKVANKIYHNDISTKDAKATTWTLASSDELMVKNRNAVLKEGCAVIQFDGNTFTGSSIRNDTKYPNRAANLNGNKYWLQNPIIEAGSGVYAEWIIQVNWDGSIEGMADVCDNLPEGFEPVYVRLMLSYPDIACLPIEELEDSSDWEKYSTVDTFNNNRTLPFYYNSQTGEVRWRLDGLVKSSDATLNGASDNDKDKYIVQCQIVCKVTDPEKLFDAAAYDDDGNSISNTTACLDNSVVVTANSDGTEVESRDTSTIQINTNAFLSKTTADNTIEKDSIYDKSTIKFKITVNEKGVDLSASGENTLPPLVDELNNADIFMFEENSLVITDKDGNEITDFTYTIDTEGDKQLLVISGLPNNKRLDITYVLQIKAKPDATKTLEISNIVYWQGYNKPSDPQYNNEFKYALSGSIVLEGHPTINIIKVDSENLNEVLNGAIFELYKVNTDGTLSNKLADGMTNSEGNITFGGDSVYTLNGLNYLLEYNVVYCIKETQSPDGYKLKADEAVHYLVVVNNTNEGDFDPTAYPNIIA